MLLTKSVPLSNAKSGDIFRIVYGKNESRGEIVRTGKVLSVRDTVKDPISHEHKMRHKIMRSRYLITMQEPDGKLRCFYAETVAALAHRLTWVGRVWNWVCGVRFPS